MASSGLVIRLGAEGGETLKAALVAVGAEGRKALKELEAASLGASGGLEGVSGSSDAVVAQLQALANRSAETVAQLNAGTAAYQAFSAATVEAVNKVAAGAASETAVAEAYARALDNIRAKFDPLFAQQQKHKQSIAEIDDAYRVGALTLDQYVEATRREEAANAAAAASIRQREAQVQSANGVYRSLAQNIDDANRIAGGVARSQTDFDAYGKALDDMRARFNPLFAVQQRFRATLEEIRRAHAVGAISADEMTAAIRREGAAARDSIAALKGRTVALDRVGVAGGNAAFRIQQLGFQVNDIGVQLAGGANPFTVLAQQGAQIAQIYGGNGGVSQGLKDVGGILRGVVTRFGPIGLAAGAAAGAIFGMRDAINETGDVAVTFGDTLRATFDVIVGPIYEIVRPAIERIAEWFSDAWSFVVDATKAAGNAVINAFRIVATALPILWDAGLTAIIRMAAAFPVQLEANWTRIRGGWFELIGAMEARFGEFLAAVSGRLSRVPGFDGAATFLGNEGFELMALGSATSAAGRRIAAGAAAGDAEAARLRGSAAQALSDAYEEVIRKGEELAASDPLGDLFDSIAARAREIAAARAEAEGRDGAGSGGAPARTEALREERDRTAELIVALELELAVMREADPVRRRLIELTDDLAGATAGQRAEVERLLGALDEEAEGFAAVGRALRDYSEDAKRTGVEIGDALGDAFGRAEDALVKFSTTGKLSFRSLASSIIEDLIRIQLRATVTGPLAAALAGGLSPAGGVPGIFGGGSFLLSVFDLFSARGTAFSGGNVVPFARGGVVDRPTAFGFRGGTGLMGEAGSEAILPLARTRSGDLGVRSLGGSGPNIFVDARNASDPAQVRAAAEAGARMALAVYKDRDRRGP